ncbi:N-acetylmuramoyl-L-alanine amidase [Clostridiales bacterium 1_7_47FAA]|nr:N-acetylmuramoyl-L-alanine amidase [Clostridiales bacterium 1_7_47FAA]
MIIDAGHGGEEPGAMFNGRREKDDALRLALAIGQILENNGVDVVYTRTTDVFDTPLEKAQIANRSGADYFVSIHRNAMPVPGTGSGATVLVYENAGVPAMLAENIQRNLVQTGFNDLGIQERPGLIVLRRTQMPAVLVEAGFIDNPEDNRFFDENFDAIAQAIADGILETIRQQEEQRPEYYQVQVGAFRTRMPADRLVNELQAKGLPAFVVYDDGLYKVRVGAFLNMDYAVRMERTLRNLGYPTVLVKERAIY